MKKNKKGFYRCIVIAAAAFFYILAAASILFVAYAELHPRFRVSPVDKMTYALLIAFCMILATRLAISVCRFSKTKRRAARICVLVLFIYYALILANLLFFDAYFFRNAGAGDWRDFSAYNTNFKPFETIKLYIESYRQETLNKSVITTNLIGNLLAFSPMGFFLPVLFPKMRKAIPYIFITLLMVCAVEGIQFVTMVGSCDIDDVILNFTGAFLTFLILKLPPLQKWLMRMY